MSEEVLEKLFGREFVERYQQARAKAEQISKAKLEEIRQFALDNMSNSENFALKYDNFDVLLVQSADSPDLLEVRKTSTGNWRVVAIWYGSKSLRGPFISVFCGLEEHARQIVRHEGVPSIIVGRLREDLYEGDISYSFRCQGVIPLGQETLVV